MNNAILVIDDDARDIHLLSQMLLSEGYQIFAALTGREGFARALEHRPAVILLDLHMPGMGGLSTARLIKSEARLAHIPLLFLTGSAALTDKLSAFNLGAVDYVTKPFSTEEVVARVRVHARLGNTRHFAEPAPPHALETPVPNPLPTQGQRLVRKAQALLNTRLSQPINLIALAHEVGTNERRLTTEFKQHTGMAVFEYLRDQRQRKACELLLHTDLAVGTIAAHTGYRSAAAFTFAFRQHFGLTPSDYRSCAGVPHSPTPDR